MTDAKSFAALQTKSAKTLENAARFDRVALPRFEKAMKAIELLGNCANRRDYDYSPWVVAERLDALVRAINAVAAAYQVQINTEAASPAQAEPEGELDLRPAAITAPHPDLLPRAVTALPDGTEMAKLGELVDTVVDLKNHLFDLMAK